MKNNQNGSLLLKKYHQQKINLESLCFQDDSLELKTNDIRTEIIKKLNSKSKRNL